MEDDFDAEMLEISDPRKKLKMFIDDNKVAEVGVLCDLGYCGSCYTWQSGKSPGTIVRERLDRFLAKESYITMVENFEVINMPIHRFDHSHILFKARSEEHFKRGVKAFKFEALWLSTEECREVVPLKITRVAASLTK